VHLIQKPLENLLVLVLDFTPHSGDQVSVSGHRDESRVDDPQHAEDECARHDAKNDGSVPDHGPVIPADDGCRNAAADQKGPSWDAAYQATSSFFARGMPFTFDAFDLRPLFAQGLGLIPRHWQRRLVVFDELGMPLL
jgi:hypothetical protein